MRFRMEDWILPALAVTALFAAVPPVEAQSALPDGLYAEINTVRGQIVVRLEFEKAPMTVANFVGLAEGTIAANGVMGRRFFDGLTFHRVEPGFVIQGGDPNGNGTGGPGYQFPNEVSPELKHDGPGVMAMANSGPNTNGSQFYITMAATPHLDGGYSVFGRVVKGQDVVSRIAKNDRIDSVKIVRVGAGAKAFPVTQQSFDALVAAAQKPIDSQAAKEREASLAKIAKQYPKLTTTRSGLMYQVLKQGSGTARPVMGTAVTVHYTGKLLDGTVFDSSVQRKQPATFQVGQVIKGWNEALMEMRKGEKRLLVIPPDLGYGARGNRGIPPNAFLVFEVELLSF
jgi:FKBP-type peptidyl-prolyl cis-trans isomerase